VFVAHSFTAKPLVAHSRQFMIRENLYIAYMNLKTP